MNGYSFTRSMSFLHSWAGLLFGWVLFGIFFAGSLAIYGREVTHWATPELHGQPLVEPAQALRVGTAFLQREAPQSRLWSITFPTEREQGLQLAWLTADGERESRKIDPVSGATLRDTEGGRLFNRFHHRFGLDGDWNEWGRWGTGIAGFAMLVALVSGILIHKHIFRDMLVFRPRGSRLLAWADAHKITSVIGLPFAFLIVISSFAVNYWIYYPAAIDTLYEGDGKVYRAEVGQGRDFNRMPDTPAGQPSANLPPERLIAIARSAMRTQGISSISLRDPGRTTAQAEVKSRRDDRIAQQMDSVILDARTGTVTDLTVERPPMFATQSVMVGVHYALFGGWPMRLVYFACGLMVAAAIATGSVLFLRKRVGRNTRWATAAARINPGAIMGPPVAAAAYLWGLRLIADSVAERPSAEASVFYYTLLAAILFALCRRPQRSWVELSAALSLLCLSLPLSALATERGGLPATIGAGDFVTAGVDLAALAIGAMAGLLACHLHRRSLAADPAQ